MIRIIPEINDKSRVGAYFHKFATYGHTKHELAISNRQSLYAFMIYSVYIFRGELI